MRTLLIACVLGATLALPGAAAADLRVPAGNRVDAVKAIGESVQVDGTSGSVIVIDGDLTVGPRGRVSGAVVLGGRITTRPGGEISGEVFHVAGHWPRLAAWQLLALLLLLFALRIAVCWALIGAAVQLAERPIAQTLAGAVRVAPLKTLAVGALAAFGIGAAALVSALSVVGLAVTAALAGVLVSVTVAGVALALQAAGSAHANRRLATVALVMPFAGDALAALAAVVGMGAVLRHVADQTTRSPLTRTGRADGGPFSAPVS